MALNRTKLPYFRPNGVCTGENEFATKRDILRTLANALIDRSVVEKIDIEWRYNPNGYEHKISAPIILLRKVAVKRLTCH